MSKASRRVRWMIWSRRWALSCVSKSQVSRLCREIDERINVSLNQTLEGEWPYLWRDVSRRRPYVRASLRKYIKVRCGGRNVSGAAIVAIEVNLPSRPTSAQSPAGQRIGAFEPRHPKLVELRHLTEDDVLAHTGFPRNTGRKPSPRPRLNAKTRRTSSGPPWSASFPTKPKNKATPDPGPRPFYHRSIQGFLGRGKISQSTVSSFRRPK